ncbi:hypothetical protein EGT07_13390 [Herbaspirillum sp. HC18]|nr:hypothetical protein EGT07_13390 [Herbaspirillum sp. HC18]
MKQTELSAVVPKNVATVPAGDTSAKKASAGGLHAAQTVVAAVGRKKASRAESDRVPGAPASQERASELGDSAFIGHPASANAIVPDIVADGAGAAAARAPAQPRATDAPSRKQKHVPGAIGAGKSSGISGAAAFLVDEASHRAAPASGRKGPGNDGIGGLSTENKTPHRIDAGIPGIDDRAAHLAMAVVPGRPALRRPRLPAKNSLPALRPSSRAECERRCGSDGFCDPSSELGCGGIHCGRKQDKV